MIQSTESSNRIEGVVAPPQRIRDLVAKRTQPANCSEQEIAGYRDVLNTIHTNFADMPLVEQEQRQEPGHPSVPRPAAKSAGTSRSEA